MPATIDEETELAKIVRWRTDELERAGYHHDLAAILGGCLDVDLHQAVEMLQQGCRQETAVLILL